MWACLRKKSPLNPTTPNSNLRSSVVKTKTYAKRTITEVEKAVDEEWNDAEILRKLIPEGDEKDTLSFVPQLKDAVFCGHIMADMDSIGGAIAGAYLYGGIPARASDINSETKFALDYWGNIDSPHPVEELMADDPHRSVCLVDFQQQTQLNTSIPMGNIIGIIDHHALQSNTVVTEKPMFVDIRPWGCMCSILAHGFAVQGKFLPKHIAGIMLSAILSDTLNLRSPTTTEWDCRMTSMLVQHTGLEDVNQFAAKQFRAKSEELSLMSAYSLVNGDFKIFKFNDATNPTTTYSIGFGVIETTDAESSLKRIDEIIPEMVETRTEKELTAMMVAVVDIVNLNSTLFLCGPVEKALGVAAFGGEPCANGNTLTLPGLVSRKQDFVPPLTKGIADGWKPPSSKAKANMRASQVMLSFAEHDFGLLTRVYDSEDDKAKANMRTSRVMMSVKENEFGFLPVVYDSEDDLPTMSSIVSKE